MSSIAVTFVQADGKEVVVEDAGVNDSLMEVALNNGVEGILADCGGACACATCHVHVTEEWQEAVGTPGDAEKMTLEMAGDVRQDNSRLCCQIMLRPELDGLRVRVAPVEY